MSWPELLPSYCWNGAQKVVIFFGYTRRPHCKYFTEATPGDTAYHLPIVAVQHQHFHTAGAVHSITCIIYCTLHTRTQRQEPNSRVSHLSASCSDIQSVYGVREIAAAGCLVDHHTAISRTGMFSEQTKVPFVSHRHGQPSNHFVPIPSKNFWGTVSNPSHEIHYFLDSQVNFKSCCKPYSATKP